MADSQPDGQAATTGAGGAAIDHRYLRLNDLKRMRQLLFASKRVVEGQYAGRHASPQRGHSVEFNDYRQYSPGDEVGDIDWKVYGRSDRLYIKLFEHQTDMSVQILVDASASMGYPGRGDQRKYDHACRLAAAIAFLTVQQQDKVALGFAQQGLQDYRRSLGTYGHLRTLLELMEGRKIRGEARLAETLREFAGRSSRKGLLIVISDFLEDQAAILKALSIFTHRGNDVILLQVMHADELELPTMSQAVFVDSESRERLRVNVEDIRGEYARRLKAFVARWSAAAKARGLDYRLVSTAEPYDKALADYLFNRAGAI